MKILIAEDTEDSRIMLEMALQGLGHEVSSGTNGREALALAKANPPDLIISDILMPEMDGFDFCRKIRKHPEMKETPFIFYTATYTDRQDEELALSLGANRFVIKPVNIEELTQVIDEVMEQYRDLHEDTDKSLPADDEELERKHAHQVGKKLDKKIRELEYEREALFESEEKYRRLVEAIQDYYFFYSHTTDDRITYVSPSMEYVLGYQPDEFIEHFSRIFRGSETKNGSGSKLRSFNGALEILPYQLKIEHKNGSERWLEIKESPVLDKYGRVTQIDAIAHDITESKQAETELRKLSRAVNSSSSAIAITDRAGVIEYANHSFYKITGFNRNESIGRNLEFLFSSTAPGMHFDELWRTISVNHDWKGELYKTRKDGSLFRADVTISGIKDANGELSHYIEIMDDMTQQQQLTEQLNYQSTHDSLTGLINRREFERRLEHLLSSIQQDHHEHALCFLDLDQFKVINDTSGHIAGDELLIQLGRLLNQSVRQSDTLARLGGDEFGIIMQQCPQDHALRLATELLDKIQNFHFSWEGRNYRIGGSIGMVSITEHNPNMTELLKHADAATYMAKDLGRNRIHVYRPEDMELSQRQGEMQWVSRINHALEENRFCLFAQPIMPLTGNENLHYELLIRMIDETGDIISPGAFLPAAERYDLIEQIDHRVISYAFSMLADNPEFMQKVDFISINLSGPSLTNMEFLQSISTLLKKHGINADKICFEVTETVAISNLSAAISFITTLKKTGCRFALDDFGSGLSSFGYLKNLPVDYLKIDGMFVRDIADDPIDFAMVKSINEIGQVMGKKTIAEFVENQQIMDRLGSIGVDFGQGYHLGKPKPLKELLQGS